MSGEVIVLGANGRFGRAAVEAFHRSGWRVRTFSRGPIESLAVHQIIGDAFDPDAVSKAASGCDVIINALNPPYPRWQRDLPRLTHAVVRAAMHTGAAVMLPGNVYNYGAHMPPVLTEITVQRPTTRKGFLRVEMEAAYRDAAVPTIVLRGGDFIERQVTGNWFDSQITKNVEKGMVMYPGPLDQTHAWAYLPDMARAMAGLAAKREAFGIFEEFGFPGYSLTGRELVDAISRAMDLPMKTKDLPWPLIRLLGLAWPQMREVAEMAYLWHTPHAIDGAKLAAALPEFQATPASEAILKALDQHGSD